MTPTCSTYCESKLHIARVEVPSRTKNEGTHDHGWRLVTVRRSTVCVSLCEQLETFKTVRITIDMVPKC